MTHRLAAAAAVSIVIVGAAAAQVDDNAVTSGETMAGQLHSSGIPVGWEGEVASAFFGQGGELLPEEEIRANWGELSEGHQTQVARDCDIFMQVEEPADAAVIQRSAAEPAPSVEVEPGAERSGDAIEFQEEGGAGVEIVGDDLPGSRDQPGESADVTSDPHMEQLRTLCAALGEM